MISHAIDKQNRLGVVSIDDIENTIDNYEKQLLIKKQIYDEITSNISVAQHAIDSIEESYTLKTRLTEIQKKLIKMRDILDKKDYESSDPEFYSSKIVELDRDNKPVDSFKKILEAKNRCMAGVTAPSTGLFLWNVKFDGIRRHP
jgi:hypothetical protein